MISGDDATGHAAAFTPESAGAILAEACRTAGLDPAGAELLRLGSNAVYRLASAPVVVRIAQDPGALGEMERVVRVARWLAAEDFPATRVVPGVRQPIVAGGRVVTFWENAQDREEYARLDELGDLLRQLHWLEEPESLGLPYYDPLSKLLASVRELDGITPDDRTFLEERAGRLQKDYDRLDFVLPFGAIHGDANVGNAIRHRDGHAILIDLDGFSLAHREWDLVLTSLYYERFGWHSKAEYESFVYHYGFELMNWPGYPVLADVRELMMTLWLGKRASVDARVGEEFARRVNTLRIGGSRRDWRPF
ncbi:aminoglycoside phosphotransferase family protein [Streptomyces sp. MP131-18]|uniref:aminoglycoside phosphotransferase family protein n=1 Tax=Streptomyces sp. MP131-18 TaxID=1857892 RepID=UPI00097BB5AF|nr:aminoglycoside phosphotransferase family protein [Streptomyces sp. MP131-18]ONK11210.1 Phosphotransferase enzyme family protein [Streptomyces sp. MP131-18]